MDFGLSPDQVLLKQTIRRWLETECPTTRVRAVMESDGGHDPRRWEALGEEGDEWDAARLTTRAQGGTLRGRKPLVPYATVADAILVAAADGDGPGLWLVEGGARGLGVTPLKGTDMTRRVAAVELEAA